MEQQKKSSKSKLLYIGGIIIILSPLLGYLLYFAYAGLIKVFYSSGRGSADAAQIFLSGCIFVFIFLGLSLVIIGCTERIIESKKYN